jgi:hypothetical protein
MEMRGNTSSRRGSVYGASAVKGAADVRALALLPSIQAAIAEGFVSRRGLAEELNRRGIPGAAGGKWHCTSVGRTLRRLDRLASVQGEANSRLITKRVADVRAEAVGPTIGELRKAGFVSIKAIMRELNARAIPTARGNKWRPTSVSRLLSRLERLAPSSPPGATSDARPK